MLSAGPGDSVAMTSLADSQWSIMRALVAQVASGFDGTGNELQRVAAEGWSLILQLDDSHPEAVREILTYPYARTWATRCLSPEDGADRDLDRAHMAGLAAAAAMRAGIDAELHLPVRDGVMYLPGIGALAVTADEGRTAPLRVSGSGLSIRHDAGQWRAVRRVAAAKLSVTVDDIDPFRGCHAFAVAGRLPATAWTRWRAALTAAARQLAVEVPGYADVVGTGLRSVVPMRPALAGHRQSGTARHAFGALALALPEDVDGLSELLVHEMQHVKLTALCDLFDLFDRSASTLFTVPWREDRRPVEGLLHGTYAWLAVADLWRSRSRRRGSEEARRLFLTYRSWVEPAVEKLRDCGLLTAQGKRFADGMRTAVEAWTDEC